MRLDRRVRDVAGIADSPVAQTLKQQLEVSGAGGNNHSSWLAVSIQQFLSPLRIRVRVVPGRKRIYDTPCNRVSADVVDLLSVGPYLSAIVAALAEFSPGSQATISPIIVYATPSVSTRAEAQAATVAAFIAAVEAIGLDPARHRCALAVIRRCDQSLPNQFRAVQDVAWPT